MTVAVALGEPGELTATDFRRVATLLKDASGIFLAPGKESLVRARLASRIRALALPGYTAYVDLLARDPRGPEMDAAIDLLTTNKTNFFREPRHFDFLSERLREKSRSRLRIWCAAASTGEEPYTIAMTLAAAGVVPPHCDTKILATDICRHALATAEAATYRRDLLTDVPSELAAKYFEHEGDTARVKGSLRALVTYGRLNLMEPWPMHGPFDFIFCRNVMIYFDTPTRERLVERMRTLLAPGGYLMIGHAESLSSLVHQYAYVQPAVYQR